MPGWSCELRLGTAVLNSTSGAGDMSTHRPLQRSFFSALGIVRITSDSVTQIKLIGCAANDIADPETTTDQEDLKLCEFFLDDKNSALASQDAIGNLTSQISSADYQRTQRLVQEAEKIRALMVESLRVKRTRLVPRKIVSARTHPSGDLAQTRFLPDKESSDFDNAPISEVFTSHVLPGFNFSLAIEAAVFDVSDAEVIHTDDEHGFQPSNPHQIPGLINGDQISPIELSTNNVAIDPGLVLQVTNCLDLPECEVVEAKLTSPTDGRKIPGARTTGKSILPNFQWIHVQLQAGSTRTGEWQRYRANHPTQPTYKYARFCALYQLWLSDHSPPLDLYDLKRDVNPLTKRSLARPPRD